MAKRRQEKPPVAVATSATRALLNAAKQRRKGLLALLQTMVECESPSDDPAAVNRCVDLVSERCVALGGRVKRHRARGYGDLLEVRFGPAGASGKSRATRSAAARAAEKERPLLLLGHLDTVWPLGTLRQMPFRVSRGRVWGPGVLDMKAGVAMALTALELLAERGELSRPVTLLLNSDEEVGSHASRPLTERLALESGAVYVLEPAQGLEGAYKTARKGVGVYRLQVQGVAAHSGVDFDRGHSAVNELARQIERITSFTEPERGLTVNAGVIGGGTRSNVVAAEAWAEIDVRVARAADAARIERRFRSLRAVDRQCTVSVAGGLNRPPMERTRATAALFQKAATLATQLGFELNEAATGGGSDGNFTSALGVPTLDGMGAVGEGAHATHESLLLAHLAPRTALLATLIAEA